MLFSRHQHNRSWKTLTARQASASNAMANFILLQPACSRFLQPCQLTVNSLLKINQMRNLKPLLLIQNFESIRVYLIHNLSELFDIRSTISNNFRSRPLKMSISLAFKSTLDRLLFWHILPNVSRPTSTISVGKWALGKQMPSAYL